MYFEDRGRCRADLDRRRRGSDGQDHPEPAEKTELSFGHRRRRGGRSGLYPERDIRSCDPGRDAAEAGRLSGAGNDPGPRHNDPGAPSDGALVRGGSDRGPGQGRGLLFAEAVLRGRAHGLYPGASAPPPGTGQQRAHLWGPFAGRGKRHPVLRGEQRQPQQPGVGADTHPDAQRGHAGRPGVAACQGVGL